MSCCGGKRQASQQRRIISVTPRPLSHEGLPQRVPMAFRGAGACLITGPHTQEVYHFSASQPQQLVHARDAEAMLRTGLFEAELFEAGS